MTRTSSGLNCLLIAGLFAFLSISACNSENQQEELTAKLSIPASQQRLDSTLEEKLPGFQFSSGVVHENQSQGLLTLNGDFNGDGRSDTAAILKGDGQWKLVIFLKDQADNYSVKEITSFPGPDSEWQAVPSDQLQLSLKPREENQTTDVFGLSGTETESALEFYWSEKTKTFVTVRVNTINDQPTTQPVFRTTEPVISTVSLIADNLDLPTGTLSQVDLDRESKGLKVDAEADIRFIVSGGSMLFYSLDPINGAIAAPYGMTVPGYDDCLNLQSRMSEGTMPEIEVGMQFCVTTNQQNIVHMEIESLDLTKNAVTLHYQTWAGNH